MQKFIENTKDMYGFEEMNIFLSVLSGLQVEKVSFVVFSKNVWYTKTRN